MAGKSISIIIPNYNGRHLLEAYLPFTLAAIKEVDVDYEIIVVDDCSKDDSVEFVRLNYPSLKLILNAENKGFSYTCNRGIEAAWCDLILLLNSDVKLTTGYFEEQFKYFELPDTFGVMGRIIDMEGDGMQDAARMPGFNGLKLKTAFFYYTDNNDDFLYTLYLSGANALVDAVKIKAIAGFDELFSPFYSEDMELSLRAWRLGWKCYYEHGAICRHQVSASTKNYQTAKWVKRIYYRNRFYVHAIHLNGVARLGWFMQITLVDLLPKLLAGQFWLLKSYVELLKHYRLINLSRKRFEQQLLLQHCNNSLFDIVHKIRSSAAGKKLTRFKP